MWRAQEYVTVPRFRLPSYYVLEHQKSMLVCFRTLALARGLGSHLLHQVVHLTTGLV